MLKFIKEFYQTFKLPQGTHFHPRLGFISIFTILIEEYLFSLMIYSGMHNSSIPFSFRQFKISIIYAILVMVFVFLFAKKCNLNSHINTPNKTVFLNTIAWPWFLIRIPRLIQETKLQRRLAIIEEVTDL
jgi:hypothetical protein